MTKIFEVFTNSIIKKITRQNNQAKRRVIFGLGSNLGDRSFYLEKAVKSLAKLMLLTNLKRSKILKNPALLLPNSPKEWDLEFFNIALSADIDLQKFPPPTILKIVKKI